jgi:hypothetical protein
MTHFLDMDLVHNAFMDRRHDIFLDLDLVHNIFLDLDLVHDTLADLVHDQRGGSKECSQCLRNVHGSKDD